jgi:hypothetical protein
MYADAHAFTPVRIPCSLFLCVSYIHRHSPTHTPTHTHPHTPTPTHTLVQAAVKYLNELPENQRLDQVEEISTILANDAEMARAMRMNELFYNISDADLNKNPLLAKDHDSTHETHTTIAGTSVHSSTGPSIQSSAQRVDAEHSNRGHEAGMPMPQTETPIGVQQVDGSSLRIIGQSLLETMLDAVRRCVMPSWMLAALTRRMHVHSACVEPMTDGPSPVAESTRRLRACMYALLDVESVTEKVRFGLATCELVTPSAPRDLLTSVCNTTILTDLLKMPQGEREGMYLRLVSVISASKTHSATSHSTNNSNNRSQLLDAHSRGIEQLARVGWQKTIFGAQMTAEMTLPLAKIHAWIEYACSAASPSLSITKRDARAAIITCMLLHMGVDTTKLPQHSPSMQAAIAASYFSACAEALFGLASLLGVPHMVPSPRFIMSGRLYAHVHDDTTVAKVLCRLWTLGGENAEACDDLGEQVVREILKDTEFHTRADGQRKDAWRRGDEMVKTSEEYATTRRSLDTAVGTQNLDMQTNRGYMGADGVRNQLNQKQHSYAEGINKGTRGTHRDVDVDVGKKKVDEETLPIEEYREGILARIQDDLVTTIHGETGCGKSTMVPLFLVQDAIKNNRRVQIVVAQPRRIAAVSLAKRVAHILGEKLGKSVGYRLGLGEKCGDGDAKIMFCTHGWLLQTLAHNRGSVSMCVCVCIFPCGWFIADSRS